MLHFYMKTRPILECYFNALSLKHLFYVMKHCFDRKAQYVCQAKKRAKDKAASENMKAQWDTQTRWRKQWCFAYWWTWSLNALTLCWQRKIRLGSSRRSQGCPSETASARPTWTENISTSLVGLWNRCTMRWVRASRRMAPQQPAVFWASELKKMSPAHGKGGRNWGHCTYARTSTVRARWSTVSCYSSMQRFELNHQA